MRASWKLKLSDREFFRSSIAKKFDCDASLKLWSKGTLAFSDLLEKTVCIYNGEKFVDLVVRKELYGMRLGKFILTKRITADIHSKTKRNKRGRKKKK